ncbi:aldo/keto reductase [Dehalococcoidia bacterium]|nr:aldo/keto reductase [Dehalococcoidia bacterium]
MQKQSSTLRTMEKRSLGKLGIVSALTLGGGGIGQVWGHTTRQEAVATVREAVDLGITLLDVAPGYGQGEAELVIGEAFNGHLPNGVRVSTKCGVGNLPGEEMVQFLTRSLQESLERMRLETVDLFFLHNQIVHDNETDRYPGTPIGLFRGMVRPAFEKLVRDGTIGSWAISGIGLPAVIIDVINDDPPPTVVQAITNLLDSPGALARFDEPARPREIIRAAADRGIGIMGIRAVQAGALTDSFDRPLPDGHPEMLDFARAEPFRALAKELGESTVSLAHRYALSMHGVSTIVLGVKNRAELRDCVNAEAKGRLTDEILSRIDASI